MDGANGRDPIGAIAWPQMAMGTISGESAPTIGGCALSVMMANMHVIEHLGKYLDTLPIKILILFRAQLRSVYCQMSPVRPSHL